MDWARANKALVIEDDYDAEYRYDREPLTSLHAHAPDHVLAMVSVSKVLSPSMRLGWMVAPEHPVAVVAEIKANLDLGTSALLQRAFADFLETGAMDHHVRRTRGQYRKRRAALVATLNEVAPRIRVDGIAAGLHVLIGLERDQDEATVVARARDVGFAAQPLSHYRHSPRPPGIVLGYAALRPASISLAARRLARDLDAA